MSKVKATALTVWPESLSKGEREACVGVWFSHLTPPEQIEAASSVIPGALRPVGDGAYAIGLIVPATTPFQARVWVDGLASRVREVVASTLQETLRINAHGGVASNACARKVLGLTKESRQVLLEDIRKALIPIEAHERVSTSS